MTVIVNASMDLSDNFCKQVNITSSMLFEDDALLPDADEVRSGLLLELHDIQKCGSLVWVEYRSWMQSLLNSDSYRVSTYNKSL